MFDTNFIELTPCRLQDFIPGRKRKRTNYSFLRRYLFILSTVLYTVTVNIGCFSESALVDARKYAMRFRKPSWLRVKSVNFDFSGKSSSTDYNEPNKPTPNSLAHMSTFHFGTLSRYSRTSIIQNLVIQKLN